MKHPMIMISSGEPSGDMHAAELAKLLPNAIWFGMGGSKSRQAGISTTIDSEKTGGVMGFYEALKSINKSRAAIKTLVEEAKIKKPEVLIIIDYPEFNIKLATAVKKLGTKIIYFIPPKVWAWRAYRAQKLAKLCDGIATIFPFEKKFLENYGCSNVKFVGHPFSNNLKKDHAVRENIRKKFNLQENDKLLAVFPGSRKQEVLKHLKPVYGCIEILNQKLPGLKTIIVKHPSLSQSLFEENIPANTFIEEISPIHAITAADFGILKSGTCNLEAAFLDLPFICIYKASGFAAFIVKNFIKLKEFSPVNIIRKGTVPEVLQERVNAQDLSEESLKLLVIDNTLKMLAGFTEVKEALSSADNVSTYENVVKILKSYFKA